MSLVKVGDICIGTVVNVLGKWVASRVDGDAFIVVGEAPSKTMALNLVARSLIAKSMEEPGALNARQREKIANISAMLNGLGMESIVVLIEEALKP